MSQGLDRRSAKRKGRRIIASWAAILLSFPAGCAVNSNSLRVVHAEMGLQAAQGRLKALKRQLFRCEEQIVATQTSLSRARVELGKTSQTEAVISRQLAKALAKLRLMEEDLAAAIRRQAKVAAQLAPIVVLQEHLATRAASLAALQKQRTLLDEQLATGVQSVATKTAELSVLKARLAAFEAVRVQFEAAAKALQQVQSLEPPDQASEKKSSDQGAKEGTGKTSLLPLGHRS